MAIIIMADIQASLEVKRKMYTTEMILWSIILKENDLFLSPIGYSVWGATDQIWNVPDNKTFTLLYEAMCCLCAQSPYFKIGLWQKTSMENHENDLQPLVAKILTR